MEGNNFDNEKEIEEKLNPVSISSFFLDLKEEVKAYYENSSN
ncbi:MAG: hypothetical protein E7D50_01545 [Finegoldia magna]|nr:hypothetical protein [Finegoldia magna]